MPIRFEKRIAANASATGLGNDQFVYVLNALTKQLTSNSAFTKVASGMLVSIANEIQFRASTQRIWSNAGGTLNIAALIKLIVGASGADFTVGPGTGAALAFRPDNTTSADDVDIGTSAVPFRNGWFDGGVNVQAGNAASTWMRVGGQVYVAYADENSNNSGADDQLHGVSLAANFFENDGDGIHWFAAGTTAGNGNNKTIKAKFGTQQLITTGALAFNATDWFMFGSVIRTGASAQRCITHFMSNSNLLPVTVDYVTATEATSGAIVIQDTAVTGTASDVTSKMFEVYKTVGA